MKKRFDWLIQLVKTNNLTLGAEVGVYKGATTRRLLQHCPKLRLYAIDLWKFRPDVMGERERDSREFENQNDIYNQFRQNIKSVFDRVKIVKGVSWEVAEQVPDGILDFVFVDADHCYDSVVKDIRAWTPKLKPEGYLVGHDFQLAGVRKAVELLTDKYELTGVDNVWWTRKENVQL